MTTFGRYLSRLYFGRAVGAVVAFTSLVQLLDLIESATELLDRGLGLSGIGYYALLRTPSIMVQAFPLGALVGALVVFIGLARGNEISVMRAAGASALRIAGWMMPAALLLAGVHFILADQIAPRTERALGLWWSETAPVRKGDERPDPKWFNVGNSIVAVEHTSGDGSLLEGVRIYERNADGVLTKRISAAEAVYRDGTWLLHRGAEVATDTDRITTTSFENRIWTANLEPDDIVGILMPNHRVSAASAWAILKGQRVGSRSPAYYRTLLHRSATGPASAFLMLILAMPAAFMLRRGGNVGSYLLPLVLGLSFLLVEGIGATFGETGFLPPALAAWGPLLLFLSIGLIFLTEPGR